MGRETKPGPTARRVSLTPSFSLPTISLPSRSKPPPPPAESAADSDRRLPSTPGSAQPFPTGGKEPHTRPSSPLKQPTSPGSSVPLPSIRSLRSRFSFSSGSQDQANTPSRPAHTPRKRVTSRRFLPFGNSNPTAPSSSSSPNVPRMSLGDVFSLGRSSTSSRLDATSTRSATPSARSARSVTSAATLRGWSSSSKHLEPGIPRPRVSFGRPRSQDYSAAAELGYTVTIGATDETIRQRPNMSISHTAPLMSHVGSTLEESSQEDVTTAALTTAAVHVALSPSQKQLAPIAPARPNGTAQPADRLSSISRQLTVPPAEIQRPSLPIYDKAALGLINGIESPSTTTPGSDTDWENHTPSTYLFTPVDDRSDLDSSAHTTPSSAYRSVPHDAVAPPLPCIVPHSLLNQAIDAVVPPEALDQHRLAGSPNPWVDCIPARPSTDSPSSQTKLPTQQTPTFPLSKPNRREHAVLGLLGELDDALAALSGTGKSGELFPRPVPTEPALAPARTSSSNIASGGSLGVRDLASTSENQVATQAGPEKKPASELMSPETKVMLEKHQGRINRLLFDLDTTAAKGDLDATVSSADLDLSKRAPGPQLDSVVGSVYRPSSVPEESTTRSTQDLREVHEDHLPRSDHADMLPTHRLSYVSRSAPGSALAPTVALPSTSPYHSSKPLPSSPQTDQLHPLPDLKSGPGFPSTTSTSSPSGYFRQGDAQVLARPYHLAQSSASSLQGYRSARDSPASSKASNSSQLTGLDPGFREFSSPLSGYSRTNVRSASATVGMSRKRSASFDLSGSTTITRPSGDPFVTPPSGGPRRTDWLGPRTAKAFAAAGLLDNTKDQDRASTPLSIKTDVYRAPPWRTQQSDPNGRLGPVRSHSRLGSEIISSRTRTLPSAIDSSPSFRRGSLDRTAPSSPVSTHRTLVSSATSSSQSQQSMIQILRERHELETEALLQALAGSKQTERELRAENEQLVAYVGDLEQRIASLESERDRNRSRRRSRDSSWDAHTATDIDRLDRRRQDILVGRPSGRGLGAHHRGQSVAPSRSSAHGANRPVSSPNDTPRSASAAAAMFRSGDLAVRPRSSTPSKRSKWGDSLPFSEVETARRTSTPTIAESKRSGDFGSSLEFEEWREESVVSLESSIVARGSFGPLSNSSQSSLITPVPGGMSLLVQEEVPLSEDEYSFGSASPASVTLVQPRNSTPKPAPANISPVTAEFSFNSIPGSPRSLRLRPEEEMHLADLISLQGLEITDVLESNN